LGHGSCHYDGQEAVHLVKAMNLTDLPTGVTDWSTLNASSQPGATGTVTIRGRTVGDVQLRLVSYSAGYAADHRCHKGHIVFLLAGSATIEHEDGRRYELSAGMAYHVADNERAPHRVTSREGASVFIVD
jgi:hypothetical protein